MRLEDIITYYYFEYDVIKKQFQAKGIVSNDVFDYVKENTKEYLKDKKTNKYFQLLYNNSSKKFGKIYVITKKQYENINYYL